MAKLKLLSQFKEFHEIHHSTGKQSKKKDKFFAFNKAHYFFRITNV